VVDPSSSSQSELLPLKITLREAQRRAQLGSNYADRVVAILLSGLAAESVVGIVIGRSVRTFNKDLDAAIAKFKGPLLYRKQGERAWAARIQAQHYGTVPDHEHSIEIVSGLDFFVRELLFKVLEVDIESISIASLINLPSVSEAVSQAEEFLDRGDLMKASEWISRSLDRASNVAAILVEESTGAGIDVLDRFAAEQTFASLSADAARWTDTVNAQLDALRSESLLGLGIIERGRMASALPHCSLTFEGERVFFPDGYQPDSGELSWALGRLIQACLHLADQHPSFEDMRFSALENVIVKPPENMNPGSSSEQALHE
jgi:hypothetical protein